MRDVIHCLRGTDFCPLYPFWGTIWGKIYEKNMKTGRKYREKEKIQILIKSLIFRTLRIYIFSFYAFLFFVSLADAEVRKDGVKYIRRGNFSYNVAEMIQTFTEILGHEVGGDIVEKPLFSSFHTFQSS